MKKITAKAAAIFSHVLQALHTTGTGRHIFNAGKDYPLCVEQGEENILTTEGIGTIYSLFQFKGKRAAPTRVITIQCIVIDARAGSDNLELLRVFPIAYLHTKRGINEVSIVIRDGMMRRIKPAMQQLHALKASEWLEDLDEKGFFN